MRSLFRSATLCVAFLLSAGFLSAQNSGEALYSSLCASCHDGGNDRAPNRQALRGFTAERVLAAMQSGSMISMANRQSTADRRAIAEFVTGKTFSQALDTAPLPSTLCKGGADLGNPLTASAWNGWGLNTSNTRFQTASAAGIRATDVPRLKLKWAFGFPGEITANAHPIVAGGRVYIGSPSGNVYSLDARTGCTHWYFHADSGVRGAVSIARIKTSAGNKYAAFFGDAAANVYAIDAETGKLLWRAKVHDFPSARVTGSITVHNGKLYIPVASGEEGVGASPTYECCRFRGSVVALDAATGRDIWKTYTIPEEALPTKKNSIGTQLWGPSGVPVWTSPAVDEKRNALYVTTGNNYSDPPTNLSDAFLALDLDSGKILWSRQMTASDAYTSACRMPDKTNCADSNGPDLDFASPAILVDLGNGKRALVSGQKSGVVHAIDPDQEGAILWQTRIGKGGTMGGVQWGSAADQSNVYVALSDIGRIMLPYSLSTDADPKVGGGMFALRLSDGKQVWYTAPPGCGDRKRCSPAQSAAVSAIPGIVFSGSVDGHMRAYSTTNGSIVWDFDTVQTYETVNKVPASGGSIDGPGPAISGGMIFFNSGYALAGGQPGNVLLVFSVDGK